MKRFSLIFKIIFIYIVINLFVFVPTNKYFYSGVHKFNSIFNDSSRLFKYDSVPDVSMAGHFINRYINHSDFGSKDCRSIIMIGDSTVEDFYVPYHKSIAHLVDEKLFGPSLNPSVFNFGSSGTKSVYILERMKKACEYKPDMIVWQMGAGSYPEVDWVFGPVKGRYDLSLGGNLLGAYENILKLNDQNAPFVATELRGNLVPIFRFLPYYQELWKGYEAGQKGVPLKFPNDRHLKVQIGDVKITEKFHHIPFDESTRNFDVIEDVAKYVTSQGIKLVIYIAPINQSILAQKYEAGYYDKLVKVVERYASPYGVPILNLYNAVPDALFIDGGHLKEKGDSIVAEKLSAFLRKELFLKKEMEKKHE